MARRILVPMDGSEMAEKALEFALEIHPDATIMVLHVVGEPSPMMGRVASLALSDDFETVAREHAQPIVDRAMEIAAAHGREADVDIEIEIGHPARTIIDRAADFDAVVMGTHGGAIVDRLIVGNVARKVFNRSPVPVTVVR